MKEIHVGSRVRIASQAILDAALRDGAGLRPGPGQMVCAGQQTSVTGYRRSPGDRSLYALRGAPGLWPKDWIEPV